LKRKYLGDTQVVRTAASIMQRQQQQQQEQLYMQPSAGHGSKYGVTEQQLATAAAEASSAARATLFYN